MNASSKLVVLRRCVHVCLLVAALASSPVISQPPIPRDDSAQRPVLDAAVAQAVEQWRQQTLEKRRLAARSTRARAVVGSVSASARCIESFVVSGSHRASAPDVRIVAAKQVDCEGSRCRGYQVTAARDGTEPFDLEVSVTCS
jgi:hypothetical protein